MIDLIWLEPNRRVIEVRYQTKSIMTLSPALLSLVPIIRTKHLSTYALIYWSKALLENHLNRFVVLSGVHFTRRIDRHIREHRHSTVGPKIC